MNVNLILKEDGKIYAFYMPEKPDYCSSFSNKYPCDSNNCEEALKAGYCLCWERMENNEVTIQQAIDSAIVCADQEQAATLIFKSLYPEFEAPLKEWTECFLKNAPHRPYEISGMRIDIVPTQVARILALDDKHKLMPLGGDVALLSVEETK